MESSTGRRLISLTIVAILALAVMAPAALAAPVPSQTTSVAAAAPDEVAIAAERELVKARLMDFGLAEEDAAGRVALLTDAEVHAIAADLESLQTAGALGDQEWDTMTVLLLLILVAILAD